MKLLELNQVSISFGGLKAVSDVNLHIKSGEVVGLIGPNGAGKTTMFNLVTGVYRPTEGSIVLNGKSIAGKKPNRITEAGIARTFQNIRLFGNLTVLDNVKIAYHNHTKHNLLQSVLATPGHFRGEAEMTAKALELLAIFGLGERKDEIAKNLPYGEQRRLEIARALAAQPKLLLLDEPAAGMNPQETKELLKLIHWVRERFDLTILLIEHHMELVMGICDRIYVLDYGKVIANGSPEEVRSNRKVIEAYLGEEVAD